MSKHSCSLKLLKGNFPDTKSAWVISALRHEPFVWISLQDYEFAAKAIDVLGNEPSNWSPASIGLLSLGIPSRTESLDRSSLMNLDKNLRKEVSQNFEELTQGKPLYEREHEENEIYPQWFIQHGLPQATKIALALRERLRLVGSWEGFQDDLEGLPNFSIYSWFAPMAILYGLIPDPQALLLELTGSSSSYEMNVLALHSFLSNPTTESDRWKTLTELFSAAVPHIQRTLINILSFRLPETGREVSTWLAEQPLKNLDNILENPGMDLVYQLASLTHKAELFRSAGLYGQSLRLMDNALKISANLQKEYSSRWYVTADQAFSESDDNNFLLDHINELSSWKQAANISDDNSVVDFDLSSYELTQLKIQIQSGNQPIIQKIISSINDPVNSDDHNAHNGIPNEIIICILKYLVSNGEMNQAKEIASNLYARINNYTSTSPEQIEAWLLEIYGFDSVTRIETLENLAEIQLKLGNSNDFVATAHKILIERPNNQRILESLGTAYQHHGQLEEALHVQELITLLQPENLDKRRKYAECLENNKDYENAFLEWSYILENSFANTNADSLPTNDMLRVASSSILAAHPEIAIEICQKILSKDVSNWHAHTLLGKALTACEKPEEGLASLQVATQLAPEESEPWLETSRIYSALGQHLQALNILQTAIQAVPNSIEIHLDLGTAYLFEDALTSAVPHLQQAYDQTQKDLSKLFNLKTHNIYLKSAENLGIALRRLGQTNESCKILESAVKSIQDSNHPDYTSLLYNYAKSLLVLGETEDAVPILEKVLNNTPSSLQPYLEYGRALLTTGGNAPAAVDALTYVHNAEPNNVEALALLADALAASNQHSKAMGAYLEVMETNITQETKWQERLNLGLGRTALALDQVETAIAALQEAANINPRNPVIQRWLADACWSANLPIDAWSAASKVLELDGTNPELLSWFADHTLSLFPNQNKKSPRNVGKSQADTNLEYHSSNIAPEEILSGALKAFRQAYPIIKDLPAMILKFGQLQAAAKLNNEAIETLRQIAGSPNPRIEDLRQASHLLFELKDYQFSILLLNKALEIPTKDLTLQGNLKKDLVRAHLAKSDHKIAEEILLKLLKHNSSDVTLYQTLSLIQFSNGDINQALKTLSDGVEKSSQDSQLAEMHYLLGWILREQGTLRLALHHALSSLTLIQGLADKRTESLDLYDVLSLSSKLSRSLLEPDKVKGFLIGLPKEFDVVKSNPTNIENVIDCYCTAAELALEAKNTSWAVSASHNISTIQSLYQTLTQPTSIRAKSIQSQLNWIQGNEKIALENLITCKQAAETYTSGGQEKHIQAMIYPSWEKPLSKSLLETHSDRLLWDFMGIINASLNLENFEQALQFSKNLVKSRTDIPLAQLTLAKALTLAREYQDLCNCIQISSHSIKIDSIIQEPGQAFNKAITETANALASETEYSEFIQENEKQQEPVNSEYQRWNQRGRAVWQELSTLDLNEWSLFTTNASDIAARLAFINRWLACNEHKLSVKDLVSSEITRADNYKDNQEVMFQIALLSEKYSPNESLMIAHNLVRTTKDMSSPSQQAKHQALLAHIAYRLGESATSYHAIQAALNIWPSEPLWHLHASKILLANPELKQGEHEQSILNHLEQAIHLDPDLSPAYTLFEKLLENTNTITPISQHSIAVLENAVTNNPDHPDILLALAKAYFLNGKLSDQKQVIQNAKLVIANKKAIKSQTNEAELLLAKIALQKKDSEEAFKLAGSVRNENPENEQAILIQIQALQMLGQHAQALNELENIPEIVNRSKILELKLAELVGICKSKNSKLKTIEVLANKYPNDLDVLWSLSQSLTEMGQTDLAVQTAQNALKNAPTNGQQKYLSELHLLLGNLLSQLGQLDQAVHHLSKSIENQPEFAEPYLTLGEVYQKQRLHLKARKTFQQAIKIAPHDPRPYIQAALSLKEGKDYQSAETMLRKAAELSPHDVNIRKQLAAVVAINLVNNPNPVHF